MFKLLSFSLCLSVFFLFSFVQAQNGETIVKEIRTKSDSRQLAQKKALNELSRELVAEMIGKDKYQEEKQRIEKYIIKNRNRYILSTRSSRPAFQDNGDFSFTVTIKVSKENLKNLLLEHNLFYASEGSFCLLPIVSFIESLGSEKKSYSWWLKTQNEPAEALLKPMASSFFNLLSKEFVKHGFYALNPIFQRMNEGTPFAVLPKKSSNVRNFVPLAEFYTCDIILSGYVQVGAVSSSSLFALTDLLSPFKKKKESSSASAHWIQFSFNVFNIKTRQFLFKLKRQFPFPLALQKDPKKEMISHLKDILDSLIYQLSSYQEEGSLDLNRLMISVQGPLTYAQKEQLKKILVQKIPGIQSLEEKLLTSSRVMYLAESSQNIKVIAKQLKEVSLSKFIIQVKGYKKQELEIYAKKRER